MGKQINLYTYPAIALAVTFAPAMPATQANSEATQPSFFVASHTKEINMGSAIWIKTGSNLIGDRYSNTYTGKKSFVVGRVLPASQYGTPSLVHEDDFQQG